MQPGVERLQTAVPGLDAVAEGGLPMGRATLVVGTAGAGKTVLATQFLAAGIAEFGHGGVLVTFDETPEQVARNCAGFGCGLEEHVAASRLALVDCSPAPGAEVLELGESARGRLGRRGRGPGLRLGGVRPRRPREGGDMSFGADVQARGDAILVRFEGELDDTTAPDARAALGSALGRRPARLLIALGGLRFMDSTGIWLLVDVQRRCLEAGIELRLSGGELPEVARALEVSGLDELIRHEDAPAPAPGPRVLLRAYVARESAASAPVLEAVRALERRLPPGSVEVEIIDVLEAPARADADRVIATPTLVKVEPGPELRMIGAPPDGDAVLRHLGLEHLAA